MSRFPRGADTHEGEAGTDPSTEPARLEREKCLAAGMDDYVTARRVARAVGLPLSCRMHGFPPLPCFPCPHHSACCTYGVTLSEEEAAAISRARGAGTVYRTRWGEWRTRVRDGRCVFLTDNRCTIHTEPFYPAVCRGFPWTDAETGGPYEYDRTICPEFIHRPELVHLHR